MSISSKQFINLKLGQYRLLKLLARFYNTSTTDIINQLIKEYNETHLYDYLSQNAYVFKTPGFSVASEEVAEKLEKKSDDSFSALLNREKDGPPIKKTKDEQVKTLEEGLNELLRSQNNIR